MPLSKIVQDSIDSSQALSTVGIKFPATQNASSDANTLDDYEEGTFTISTSASGYTISSYTALYTKIGRVVNCNIKISFSAIGSSNSSFVFTGAPFSPATPMEAYSGVVRENSSTGAIYVASIQTASANMEINSMDSVATNSQRTLRTGESYVMSLTYLTST